MASSKLLLAAKSLSVDPGAANAKNLLAVAARCDKMQITQEMHLSVSFLFFSNKRTAVSVRRVSSTIPNTVGSGFRDFIIMSPSFICLPLIHTLSQHCCREWVSSS